MIRAIIFDLDGVLVQTEKMKAYSYALAVARIRNLSEPDIQAVEAFKEIIGSARDVASRHVMERLGLEKELRPMMAEYGVSQPWQVLTVIRMGIYRKMAADPEVLWKNRWPHSLELLRLAKENFCGTALVTMSRRQEVMHVLRSLGIERQLDVVLTAEDITKGKPDPEIYQVAAKRLGLPPEECLVLEDSVNGIKAAQATGMNVVAIATPFTNASIHANEIIKEAWIVHEPEKVAQVVRQRIEEHDLAAHRRKAVDK